MLSKKDLITANQSFHTGRVANEGSLEFAVSQVHRSKNWLRCAAILSRAILIDHIFEDGNKRTAAGTIATLMRLNGVPYQREKIDQIVLAIAKKNVTSINKIERMIKDARE